MTRFVLESKTFNYIGIHERDPMNSDNDNDVPTYLSI